MVEIQRAFLFGEGDGGDMKDLVREFKRRFSNIPYEPLWGVSTAHEQLSECRGLVTTVWGASTKACVARAIQHLIIAEAMPLVDLQFVRINSSDRGVKKAAIELRAASLVENLLSLGVDLGLLQNNLNVVQDSVFQRALSDIVKERW